MFTIGRYLGFQPISPIDWDSFSLLPDRTILFWAKGIFVNEGISKKYKKKHVGSSLEQTMFEEDILINKYLYQIKVNNIMKCLL